MVTIGRGESLGHVQTLSRHIRMRVNVPLNAIKCQLQPQVFPVAYG